MRELTGDWRRSLLRFEDGRSDSSSEVRWLQGPSLFCDLRQPVPMRAVAARCLRALSMADVAELARQEGFAGRLVGGDPVFEWIRLLDLQPPAAVSDRATLAWRGDVLVETGTEAAYTEHWHRDEGRARTASALRLADPATARLAILVVADGRFGFARGGGRDLNAGSSTRDLVSSAPCLSLAQDIVDCEISYGRLDRWTIERSSLPWRVGGLLNLRRDGETLMLDDVEPDGTACRRAYDIVEDERF